MILTLNVYPEVSFLSRSKATGMLYFRALFAPYLNEVYTLGSKIALLYQTIGQIYNLGHVREVYHFLRAQQLF